jgi:hypothetical protein
MKPTKSISQRVSRDSFVDPHINPEHWIGKWERGEVTSTEDSISAARAIKRSGFHQANKRYSDYVSKHLGE